MAHNKNTSMEIGEQQHQVSARLDASAPGMHPVDARGASGSAMNQSSKGATIQAAVINNTAITTAIQVCKLSFDLECNFLYRKLMLLDASPCHESGSRYYV